MDRSDSSGRDGIRVAISSDVIAFDSSSSDSVTLSALKLAVIASREILPLNGRAARVAAVASASDLGSVFCLKSNLTRDTFIESRQEAAIVLIRSAGDSFFAG